MNNEIIIFENQEIKLEVNLKEETVWLTQAQIALLFDKNRTVISKHIRNIFYEGELEEKSNVQKMHITNSDKPITIYNLDVIISVGYRVKSKRGIEFRRWANKILKDYLIKGYAVNEKRLKNLEKTIKLIDIASRDNLDIIEAKDIIKVLKSYSKGLNLLDNYDHKIINKPKGNISNEKIKYKNCIDIIKTLKFNEESTIFGLEKDKGLDSIINNIYLTFNDLDVYETIEEKAANFLYLIIKNHVFIDGNKRIGATLFIYFLQFYNILYKDNNPIIDNNTLASLTLLIAQSNPKEKEVMIDLIMNFLC
ncbi:MAG: Fic/DOC family protein [Firmicutes bacterium]|nr:Fic/DOC family protein [Bacillota bacterium]